MKGRVMLFGGLMLAAASASAQGVFSFDGIPIKGEPSVEVNMGPEMIKLLGPAAGAGSDLSGLTNVRVLVYEDFPEDIQEVLRFVEATGTKLESDGWSAVVRVREDDEQVRVYMKPGTDGTLAGVTVMVTEGSDDDDNDHDNDNDHGGAEAVFINVAGKIRPEQLGAIASGVGVNGVLAGLPGTAPKAAAD